jgi:hypothetical protein
MQLTNKQKADKLREAIALLEDVDCLQQAAIGESDVCEDNHFRIQDLIEDLTADVELFEKDAI